MRAITIWQPWATLLACGAKRYETRSWDTAYRGRLAIHAGSTSNADLRALARTEPFRSALAAGIEQLGFGNVIVFGAVIATADLVAVHRTDDLRGRLSREEIAFGDFSPGRFAWELADVRPLAAPCQAKGAQGFWLWKAPPAALMPVGG